MIHVDEKNKKKCCGCTACANICPRKAIEMKEDFEGFLYPVVDKKKCINCNLCDKTCPILNKKKRKVDIEKAYALRCKDKNTLKNSTSGGSFTPIAEYVIKNKGIVYGVGFDKKFMVCHKEATTLEQIQEFKGSKYVQSFLGDTFTKIKEQLENEKLVLFSGTPCQVEGLKKYLKKDYENLITIDIICKGVPSQKIWKEYLKYQEKKYNSKIKEIHFRNKTYGYHSGTMKIIFENGKEYYGSGRVDYMLKSYYSEICSRPSCYDCQFKSRNHISDITIYDCWSIEKLNQKVKDDDLGYTNIIVNSKKGTDILSKIKDKFYIYDVDINKQIKYDGIMVENSAKEHISRNTYYEKLNKIGLEENVKKYIPVTHKDYLIEGSKILLYKLKIMNWIKRVRK